MTELLPAPNSPTNVTSWSNLDKLGGGGLRDHVQQCIDDRALASPKLSNKRHPGHSTRRCPRDTLVTSAQRAVVPWCIRSNGSEEARSLFTPAAGYNTLFKLHITNGPCPRAATNMAIPSRELLLTC